MTGRKKSDVEAANSRGLTEGQNDLVAIAWKARLHQTGSALRNDDLLMRCNVIAMGMRNECEGFRIPRIQPKILRRQKDAALVMNIDHSEIYA